MFMAGNIITIEQSIHLIGNFWNIWAIAIFTFDSCNNEMTLRLLKTYHEIFVYTIFQIYDKFNRLLNGIIMHTVGAGFTNNFPL